MAPGGSSREAGAVEQKTSHAAPHGGDPGGSHSSSRHPGPATVFSRLQGVPQPGPHAVHRDDCVRSYDVSVLYDAHVL